MDTLARRAQSAQRRGLLFSLEDAADVLGIARLAYSPIASCQAQVPACASFKRLRNWKDTSATAKANGMPRSNAMESCWANKVGTSIDAVVAKGILAQLARAQLL
ncbi:hypothetical protein F0M17_05300 [Glutamicibacter sp. ZJUTW]|nr:hypothetical protein F0M17_05300 [Glutamicibacter sp. ZJUTW]